MRHRRMSFAKLLTGRPRCGGRRDRPAARSCPRERRLRWAAMKVLLTNDDGIEAEGLQALRRALLALPEASSSR